MYDWGSTQYRSLAALRAAVPGSEANGDPGRPEVVPPGPADFHLLAGSPAIDSANSGASGAPTSTRRQRAAVDDPATPNTGSGPRTFDDRGAFEYR